MTGGKRAFAAVLAMMFFALCVFFALNGELAGRVQAARPNESGALAGLAQQAPAAFEVIFLQAGGFYSGDVVLALKAGMNEAFLRENGLEAGAAARAEIYYTLDGTEPTRESGRLYTQPVALPGQEGRLGTPVRAKAFYNGMESAVGTNTYFISDAITQRFDMLVFSITTDPDNLYGYENGILVPGKLFYDFENSPQNDGSVDERKKPANYRQWGMQGEREVHVQVFSAQGAQLVSQNAGLRVHGDYSRYYSQKSLKLIARKDYDPNNGMFHYAFFENNTTQTRQQTVVDAYDELVLRNGGQGFGKDYTRDTLTSQLARDAGVQSTQHARPAAVYLNGEYYGFAWLTTSFNNKDLQQTHDTPDDTYQIVSVQLASGGRGDSNDEQAAAAWQQVAAYWQADLTNNRTFAEFSRLVDVDDLLRLLAVQIYAANHDFYNSNLKAFRYVGEAGESSSAVTDGRWRFMLFDSDYTWAFDDASSPEMLSMTWLMGLVEEWWSYQVACPLFASLMERPDTRQAFVNMLCDYGEGAFSAGAVEKQLKACWQLIGGELPHTFEKYFPHTSSGSVLAHHQEILRFAEKRAGCLDEELRALFGYSGSRYSVAVTGHEGAVVTMESQTLNGGGALAGRYYTENSATLKALPKYGYLFSHWLVDGQKIYTPALTLRGAAGQKIQVSPVMEPAAFEDVIISEVYYNAGADWIELYNPTSRRVNLSAYALSDTGDEPYKTVLRGLSIAPGGYLVIACKNHRTIGSLGMPSVGFNLKQGEMLVLTGPQGRRVAAVPLRDVPEGKSYAFDAARGCFRPAAPTPAAGNQFPG